MRIKYTVLAIVHLAVLAALSLLMVGGVLSMIENGLDAVTVLLFLFFSIVWVFLYLSYMKCRKRAKGRAPKE